MDFLRTPDERFADLPGYAFAPHYTDVGGLRMHFVDEGPRDAAPILLLHGEPSWSYLYRKMIPPLVAAGHRVVAPDLIGFGRSDKPTDAGAYTYDSHTAWLEAFLEALGLDRITLFCQDWGGLLGLRIAAEHEASFARIIAANTFLPTGDRKMPDAFFAWQKFSQEIPELPVGRIVSGGCVTPLAPEVIAAYDAPFPEETYKVGARKFPLLVPSTPDDPAAPRNRAAWQTLSRWKKPFLTAFGDSDPITRGADLALQSAIPGCADQPHATLPQAGHFLQEDRGPDLADLIISWI